MPGRAVGGTWLASTSVSFDISGVEMYVPLASGGRMVVASDAEAKDPAALLRLMDAHEVTDVQATPSGWRLLLASGFDRPAVRALVGGEALPTGLARELRGRVAGLTNVYGPTETTIWSTFWEVPGEVEQVLLGGPLARTQTHVLDTSGQPVPDGGATSSTSAARAWPAATRAAPALRRNGSCPIPSGRPDHVCIAPAIWYGSLPVTR
ncbi:hypothetical protein GCM10020000_12810 [Streptomyces olivoverticillatus]